MRPADRSDSEGYGWQQGREGLDAENDRQEKAALEGRVLMTTDVNMETLIADVKQVVAKGIAYVQANADSEVKIDIWTPREVLCHWIAWHRATVEGMEGVVDGSGAYRFYASPDEMNARSVGRKSGWTMSRLVEEMEDLQERLVSAARAMPDANAVVIIGPEGSELSMVQCLESLVIEHWNEHLDEMAAAG